MACLEKYFYGRIWASLIPIVGGILLTSVTELSFNMFGFSAALLGCLATSTKIIMAESLLHGYKFDRFWSGSMASDPPVHRLIPRHHIQLRRAGFLSKFLNLLCDSPNHCSHLQCCWKSLKVAVAVLISWLIFRNPIMADIQESDIIFERSGMRRDTRWMYILWICAPYAISTTTWNALNPTDS